MRDMRDLARLSEPELDLALRDLGRALAWPAPAPSTAEDAAARARRRIVESGTGPAARRWTPAWPGRRPLGSSLGLALVALLVIVAIAAAIGLGLPGIRILVTSSPVPSIVTQSPSPSPSPRVVVPGTPTVGPLPTASPGPLGWRLGLGIPLAVAGAPDAVAFPVRLPAEPYGPPTAAWLLDGRVSFVWPASERFPPLQEPGLGLVLTEMQGDVDAGYFEKILGPGTQIETVVVDGTTGYWISGQPHEIVYVNPSGEPTFDTRRIVGDTLMWARDGITYRLESALGRDAAIALADGLR